MGGGLFGVLCNGKRKRGMVDVMKIYSNFKSKSFPLTYVFGETWNITHRKTNQASSDSFLWFGESYVAQLKNVFSNYWPYIKLADVQCFWKSMADIVFSYQNISAYGRQKTQIYLSLLTKYLYREIFSIKLEKKP